MSAIEWTIRVYTRGVAVVVAVSRIIFVVAILSAVLLLLFSILHQRPPQLSIHFGQTVHIISP